MPIPILLMLAAAAAAAPPAVAGEEAVAPYVVSDANAGARPFAGDGMARAFHGQAGIGRIVDRFVAANFADAEIGAVFAGQDRARITRLLKEQFAYILNGGGHYSGRDMAAAHRDMGVQHKDMNRLVENLQAAMRAEGVPFAAQNRFLSRLAPMRTAIVTR